MASRYSGLIAATFTAFDDAGEVNLAAVEKQAEHLIRNGVVGAFVCGSTGEFASLTMPERLALTERWMAVAKGTPLRVLVHVGANAIRDARTLAAHAQQHGAVGIAAVTPSYFKPKTVDTLIECMKEIADAAPQLPFYFYDIPVMTNVVLPMPEFLPAAGKRIPNLVGIKFTNSDLMAFQQCLHIEDGRYEVLWGSDEYLMAALALGGAGAVGSTYNYAAPIYNRMMAALKQGDLATARKEQFRSVQFIAAHMRYGFMPTAKALMEMLGVPVGAPRLPLPSLPNADIQRFRAEMETLGFFDWVANPSK